MEIGKHKHVEFPLKMADVFSKETRSKIMSKIRSKNTAGELLLRKCLKGTNLRFHPSVYGRPDFGNAKRKIAVFVDGCFWHKCKKCFIAPKSNKKYWIYKIEGNVKRDKEVNSELKKQDWKVIRFWEHQVIDNPQKCADKIKMILKER
ncbi:MAG: very short patch repair endonuclease [Candidatus Woesearchaeota archaeon]|nr:very short patch repair endonuclease [Candidatus Woesearchaeota archaeon]